MYDEKLPEVFLKNSKAVINSTTPTVTVLRHSSFSDLGAKQVSKSSLFCLYYFPRAFVFRFSFHFTYLKSFLLHFSHPTTSTSYGRGVYIYIYIYLYIYLYIYMYGTVYIEKYPPPPTAGRDISRSYLAGKYDKGKRN
jgi:hypothetical protein